MKFETKAIHGVRNNGEKVEEWGSTIDMASTFPIREFGVEQEFEYSRVSNPTRRELERLLAQLESGKHGFAFSSGMAAISTLLSVFEAGDHFIFGLDIYGGTFRIIRDIFGKFGLKASFVDTTNLENIRKAILPSTKGIFIETPSNPLLDITDIEGVVAIAREHKLITIVDNTFMSPYLQRPLE